MNSHTCHFWGIGLLWSVGPLLLLNPAFFSSRQSFLVITWLFMIKILQYYWRFYNSSDCNTECYFMKMGHFFSFSEQILIIKCMFGNFHFRFFIDKAISKIILKYKNQSLTFLRIICNFDVFSPNVMSLLKSLDFFTIQLLFHDFWLKCFSG